MMIILESDYQYGNYLIYDDNGVWTISDIEGNVIESGFSTEDDAKEFIDSGYCDKGLPIEDEDDEVPLDDSGNNLPVKSTTVKTLKSKYSDCKGVAYVLKSQYGRQYASRRGICNYQDPDMVIFKSAEDARYSRLQRKSDFGIEEVTLSNGEVSR